MDQQFQTSFIPRKPTTQMPINKPAQVAPLARPSTSVSPQAPDLPERGVSLAKFFSTIVFIGALISAVGVFLYKGLVDKNIAEIIKQIELAKKDYDSTLIATLASTDRRFKSAKEVLDKHIIISPIFRSLQESTLKTVAFNNFSYNYNKEGEVIIKLEGEAINNDAIALQSDSLSKNRFIKDPVFSNLNLGETGNVSFDLEFIVDKTMLSYVDDIERRYAVENEIVSESEFTNDNLETQ